MPVFTPHFNPEKLQLEAIQRFAMLHLQSMGWNFAEQFSHIFGDATMVAEQYYEK